MELERLEKLEEQLERSLELVREQRRELINRSDMNKDKWINDQIKTHKESQFKKVISNEQFTKK